MTDCPCKGCTDRAAGCHARCENYRAWSAGHTEEREERFRLKYTDSQITSASRERWEKWKRNHR